MLSGAGTLLSMGGLWLFRRLIFKVNHAAACGAPFTGMRRKRGTDMDLTGGVTAALLQSRGGLG